MIKVSDRAKSKMIEVLKEENHRLLRFGLKGGGCSGFQYYFSMESEKAEDDLEIDIGDDFCLLVDPMSNMYLEGAEIDYKKDMMGENFVFLNPNQTGSCGCGSSVMF